MKTAVPVVINEPHCTWLTTGSSYALNNTAPLWMWTYSTQFLWAEREKSGKTEIQRPKEEGGGGVRSTTISVVLYPDLLIYGYQSLISDNFMVAMVFTQSCSSRSSLFISDYSLNSFNSYLSNINHIICSFLDLLATKWLVHFCKYLKLWKCQQCPWHCWQLLLRTSMWSVRHRL